MTTAIDEQLSETPSFRKALAFWLKLGFISFGGPSGQIAIMHQELVEKRRWIDEQSFLAGLNFCMFLPGPEAQQLATYIGWRLHRIRGGLAAGLLFILPAVLLLLVLSYVYVRFGTQPLLVDIFEGLKPGVVAIVIAALIRIARRTLKGIYAWGIAAGSFFGLFALHLPYPLIIAVAAVLGCLLPQQQPFEQKVSKSVQIATVPPWRKSIRFAFGGILLWLSPSILSAAYLGVSHVITQQGIFFSKAALITFGGAYAVLPYVSQQAVEHYHWLSSAQMLDGLGLAETTPGPLIIGLQFVGFLGAYQSPAPFSPIVAGVLGALLTTWATFVPSFLWIFIGAPYIDLLSSAQMLTAALRGVTAGVVGVILNLAIWFAIQTFIPVSAPINYFGIGLAGVLLVLMLRWEMGIATTVLIAGLSGLMFGLC